MTIMNKLLPPIYAGIISVWLAYFYWSFNLAPSGWAPYGGFCFVLMGALAILGILAGVLVGALCFIVFDKYEIPNRQGQVYSSILTAVFVGVIAVILY